MRYRPVNTIAAVLLLLLIWQLGSMALNKAFLPSPVSSFAAFFSLIANGALLPHFGISAMRLLVSIAIALVLAVPIGFGLGRDPGMDRHLGPLVYILYPLPKAVFLPVIVVLLGLGNAPKILLITLVIFFQIVIVARDAAKSIPKMLIDTMRSLNGTRWQTFRYLILPYCLSNILTSLRITLGSAIAVLFFAETFASFDGMGYFILNSMETREYPSMYAGIIGLAVLGLLCYAAVDLAERRLCRWQRRG
jgi:NitT/TauT family transport system permease protein